jgi:DinB superfamily
MQESEREAILERLSRMPGHLADAARRLGAWDTRSPEGGGFSLVEHVWHLADLEQEAYAVRIRRIRDEDEPVLADFDGARLAAERKYRRREIGQGLLAFARARSANLAALRQVSTGEWGRRAVQDEVGPIALDDIPRMMEEHDESHRREIEHLLAALGELEQR